MPRSQNRRRRLGCSESGIRRSGELYFEAPGRLMAVAISGDNNALGAGTPQKLFDIRTQWFVGNQPHNVEVAANGQNFLVNTIVGNSDNAPLEVTVNWLRALR